MKHTTNRQIKRYTSLRRFYAWTGFVTLLILIPVLLALLVWANSTLLTNGLI